MKHALLHCSDETPNKYSIIKDYFKLDYYDDFSFDMPRFSEVTITSDTDTSSFKDDFIDDNENGVWKGWIFASPLTERKDDIKSQVFYLEL